MVKTLLLFFGLVAVTAGCAIASRRMGMPHSILLVLTGLALAIIPGLPIVELDPTVVMLLFLPPLLYSAGVSMSWQGFRKNLGPITLLAIGCVLFTGGCALRARLALGGGFRPRCGGLPTGHRGPHGHRAAPPCSKANPDYPRG